MTNLTFSFSQTLVLTFPLIMFLTVSLTYTSSFVHVTTPPSFLSLKSSPRFSSQSRPTLRLSSSALSQRTTTSSSQQTQTSSPSHSHSSSQNESPPNNPPIHTLLINNYDSYTYNLYQLIAQSFSNTKSRITVVNNDEFQSYNACRFALLNRTNTATDGNFNSDNNNYKSHNFDNIVISPGPGTVVNGYTDFGFCESVFKQAGCDVPVLGVCLGHQGLGFFYRRKGGDGAGVDGDGDIGGVVGGGVSGGEDGSMCVVKKAKVPMHGRSSAVFFSSPPSSLSSSAPAATPTQPSKRSSPNDFSLFKGLEQGFDVIRYHSLVVEESLLGDDVVVDGWCFDKTPMNDEIERNVRLKAKAKTNAEMKEEEEDELGQGQVKTHKTVMSLKHKHLPQFGVQFHPESIGTMPSGEVIIGNFRDVTVAYMQARMEARVKTKTEARMKMEGEGDVKTGTNVAATATATMPIYKQTRTQPRTHEPPIPTPTLTNEKPQKNEKKHKILIHPLPPKTNKNKKQKAKKKPYSSSLAFDALYANDKEVFWLDSDVHYNLNRANTNTNTNTNTASDSDSDSGNGNDKYEINRYSYIGAHDPSITNENAHVVEDYGNGNMKVVYNNPNKTHAINTKAGVMDFLGGRCNSGNYEINCVVDVSSNDDDGDDDDDDDENDIELNATTLPFNFHGGYIGYLSYEARYYCTDSPPPTQEQSDSMNTGDVPVAAFIYAEKFVVFDHFSGGGYVVGVVEDGGDEGNTRRWIKETVRRIIEVHAADDDKAVDVDVDVDVDTILSDSDPDSESDHDHVNDIRTPAHLNLIDINNNNEYTITPPSTSNSNPTLKFKLNRPYATYIQNIRDTKEHIRNGDTYEVCLTNKFIAETTNSNNNSDGDGDECGIDPLVLYRELRKGNPAPFSAFLKFDRGDMLSLQSNSQSKTKTNSENNNSIKKTNRDQNQAPSVAICSTSPERFLKVDGHTRNIEAKPIKGTIRRGSTPPLDLIQSTTLQNSDKDRAENLMIVDLLRNDFGRVCAIGSVSVPVLMGIESYKTVHQLVSTITGNIRKGLDSIDVLKSCFPGGSMTGAPKTRTLGIIDDLEEGRPRGPYAGSIGYVSLNGSIDLSIVIRTAVVTKGKVEVGCGGAITLLSEEGDEVGEMVLKGEVVVKNVVKGWEETKRLCELKGEAKLEDDGAEKRRECY